MSGQPSFENIPNSQPPKSSRKMKFIVFLLAMVGIPSFCLCGGGVVAIFMALDAAKTSTEEFFESANIEQQLQQQVDQLIESHVSTSIHDEVAANSGPPQFEGTLTDTSTFKIAPDQWQFFQSSPGRFQVMLPGSASVSNEIIDSDVGKLELFIHSVSLENDSAAVVIMYNDYPDELFSSKKIAAILDDAANGVTEGHLADSLKRNILLIDGIPGREFHFKSKSGDQTVHSAWRLFLHKKRLYQVGMVGMDKPIDSKVVDYIFDSFKIDP